MAAPIRLYVFDGGTLHIPDPSRFGFTRDELACCDLAVPCFLVVHPLGTLMWDTGAVPDDAWIPTGAPVSYQVPLPRAEERHYGRMTVVRTLASQLAEIGYAASDIDYLALSHYHYDHTGNANAFAGATWLVRKAEREAMLAEPPPRVALPSSYAALQKSRVIEVEDDEHDVFGDGRVIIKAAPGHTPGHQVLYVELQKTGGVVLSGDLYHYPEARRLGRLPTFDRDPERSAASRAAVEEFLIRKRADLWIQHDFVANVQIRKAPEFHE